MPGTHSPYTIFAQEPLLHLYLHSIGMISHFPEQTILDWHIPAFTLHGGDFIVVELPYNTGSHQIQHQMMVILQQNSRANLWPPLLYAPHKMESGFRHMFWPTGVGEYLRKNAYPASPFYNKIYDIPWMKPHIHIQTLAGTPKRKLSVYATLSKTYRILFDLAGVDPTGGKEIVETIQQVVAIGGSAILFDRDDEFKNDCTQYIVPQYRPPA